MTTYSYALSRTERVWLLFSVTLLASAAFYGFLAARIVRAMSRPDLTTFLQDLPVLLFISLSAGFMLATAGHYALRIALKAHPLKEVRHG
ncbi:TPA: hypothetical protein ACHF2V_004310 [Citrobacter farmeri]|uniref:hypothetical protein n=1 Tax=Citrobacter TaxID=544 RepID=UPI000E15410F|nr:MULTISPECIES: hypothetical protein [Citrobacter]EKQ0626965.1 hypothetical protein [Salmonella enterica]MDT7072807.1 hypothetical protein [Citrobacter amalonaticus]MEC3934069.1 hypothetical protein [Citrobacter farmeri]UBI23181.1 hypothetical protein LA348_23820 [Citrobacter amalonaticus]STA62760.1 Uncharacterised protein [Citrobacter amalonaticus]